MVLPLKSVVIVGGGTAGWIVAGTLAAKHLSNSPNGTQITLIESPDIQPIGVGEGTWPTMRGTLRRMGISETDFINVCDVSFKQGAKFAQWVDGTESDYYYHPLVLPRGFTKGNLAPFWQASSFDKSFSQAVCHQESLCEIGLAPKTITTPEYEAVANYAYHLDSAKFSDFLKRHCIDRFGVKYISDNVIAVNESTNEDSQDIASVSTANYGEIDGDLFIDCTGFKSLLLGTHYEVPFVDKSDVLFVDTALAVQTPYANEQAPIASHTISTGQKAGWIWDIGLQSRKGVGYVYSSDHTSEDEATADLISYINRDQELEAQDLNIRKIPIRSGHREIFWKNNCVAVGLSAGFLEPLEASALVLVELSAQMIADQLPKNRLVMDVIAKRFNQSFLYRWDRIVDFLKLHYILSRRKEKFWSDNRNPDTIPESLLELLELWQYQHPWNYDFTDQCEVFPAASYQYVLYGMGFKTHMQEQSFSKSEITFAERQFNDNLKFIEKLTTMLPQNRDLLNKVRKYGFQKI